MCVCVRVYMCIYNIEQRVAENHSMAMEHLTCIHDMKKHVLLYMNICTQ